MNWLQQLVEQWILPLFMAVLAGGVTLVILVTAIGILIESIMTIVETLIGVAPAGASLVFAMRRPFGLRQEGY